jgi:taurine--2-oxoglutarate transaminase
LPVDHWKVVPDLIYGEGPYLELPALGAVGMRHHIAQHFQDKVFYGGLTYNSHPMGCAAALATIRVYEEDHLIESARRMGAIMKDLGTQLQARHPSVGAVRSIGLFGIVELIRNRTTRQPMAPFNGTSEEMAALGRFFRENWLYTLVRWNTSPIRRSALTKRSCAKHSPLLIRGWRLRTRR